MKWRGGRQSRNVDDRTGRSSGSGGMLAAGGGIGTVIIAVLFFLFSGGDLSSLPDVLGGSGQAANYQTENVGTSEYTEEKEFSAVVFGYLEDYWQDVFQERQETYQDPTLVLFTGSVQSACGYATSQVGPFYCPADENVYLDLSFANELSDKYGASGDFAMAYVIAHEVGHHVQKLLGIEPKVRQLQQNATQAEVNRLSVRMELQADCFAGVWGHNMQQQGVLETGDLEEALNAAQAIGDDRLQQQSQGRVVPDSFTHGTSQQRYSWFKRGFDSGDPAQCNTFGKSI